MEARAVLAALEVALSRWRGAVRAEVDDQGDLLLYVRKDMLHLDADALHDRLHHWTLTELRRALPAASAEVSFRHARPADPHAESELDWQEGWRDLEPTLRLELRPPPSAADLERLASLVPRFLALVEGEGRPQGYRSPDMGCVE